jgi:hypothetical protein
MAKGKVHVVPYGDAWAVKREGADRASKITDTKAEAIIAAQSIANANEEIIIHNKKGHITKGKKYGKEKDNSGCFITTACIRYYNLTDDCYQLSILRNYRDNYLQQSNNGIKLIKKYYSIAPQIVMLLNNHPDKKNIFKNIFGQINSACYLIERGKNEDAKKLYIKIVTYLVNFLNLG